MANVHQNSQVSQTYVFKLPDINCCKVCPRELERRLRFLRGVKSAEVDKIQNLATVEAIIDPREIIENINKLEKKAELVTEREETNPHGYTVESKDEEGEDEDLLNASGRRTDPSAHQKESSSSHQDSSARNKRSFFRMPGKKKGSSRAAEMDEYSENNASSKKEIPDHICRDRYCTVHKRDDSKTNDSAPKRNDGPGSSPLYRGSGNYSFPMMNSYIQPPPMYAPSPLPHYGQHYGPRVFPPMTGYGSYATQMQMPRPRPNGYCRDEYCNGCNNM